MPEKRLAIASDNTFKLTLNRQAGHTYDLGGAVIKVAVSLNLEGEAIACFSTQNGTIIKDEDASSESTFVGSFVLPAALSAEFLGLTPVYIFPRILPLEGGQELADFSALEKVVFAPAPKC